MESCSAVGTTIREIGLSSMTSQGERPRQLTGPLAGPPCGCSVAKSTWSYTAGTARLRTLERCRSHQRPLFKSGEILRHQSIGIGISTGQAKRLDGASGLSKVICKVGMMANDCAWPP